MGGRQKHREQDETQCGQEKRRRAQQGGGVHGAIVRSLRRETNHEVPKGLRRQSGRECERLRPGERFRPMNCTLAMRMGAALGLALWLAACGASTGRDGSPPPTVLQLGPPTWQTELHTEALTEPPWNTTLLAPSRAAVLVDEGRTAAMFALPDVQFRWRRPVEGTRRLWAYSCDGTKAALLAMGSEGLELRVWDALSGAVLERGSVGVCSRAVRTVGRERSPTWP